MKFELFLLFILAASYYVNVQLLSLSPVVFPYLVFLACLRCNITIWLVYLLMVNGWMVHKNLFFFSHRQSLVRAQHVPSYQGMDMRILCKYLQAQTSSKEGTWQLTLFSVSMLAISSQALNVTCI